MRFAPKKYDKVVLLFFFAFSIGAFFFWTFEGQFDQKEWNSSPSKRYKMVDDMISDDTLLLGKSKQQIIDILDTPSDLLSTDKDILNYKIGVPPSFTEHKREELVIEFENGISVRAFRLRVNN